LLAALLRPQGEPVPASHVRLRRRPARRVRPRECGGASERHQRRRGAAALLRPPHALSRPQPAAVAWRRRAAFRARPAAAQPHDQPGQGRRPDRGLQAALFRHGSVRPACAALSRRHGRRRAGDARLRPSLPDRRRRAGEGGREHAADAGRARGDPRHQRGAHLLHPVQLQRGALGGFCMSQGERRYPDLQEHLAALDRAGLLVTIDRPIDKDAELHPLVRWQFVGGLDEADRRAFLFTHVVDGKGRRFDMPVVVGAIAANRAIYAIGMGADVEEIPGKWERAIAAPIAPRIVNRGVCQEVVIEGDALVGPGKGLDALPIPISTPGFDSAPTLTATNVVTRDPETGVQNMGTYRAALKAPDRLVVRMATRIGGAGGYQHYLKHQKRGDKEMPCAIVLGCPPFVAFTGPQKLPVDVDEVGVAGCPINMVRAHSVYLLVPAESELVIEGMIDTEWLEPEAPFGESHGHVALEEFNMPMRVTAITHRRKPVIPSYLSQVAPSESSVIKRVAYEPLFLSFLKDQLGIKGVVRVA